MKTNSILNYFLVAFIAFSVVSCTPEATEPSTKSSMEGTWSIVEATNEAGEDITDKINFPITAFHLTSDNSIISTASPLTMFIVYGDNKYTEIASKIDQVFNYVSLDFSGGEFFLGGGVQPTFTLEMKLEGLPGQKTLTTLLDLIGIGQDYLDVVVYHKFVDVKVSFNDGEEGDPNRYDKRDIMYWEIDQNTTAEYNTKDNQGNKVLWGGFSVTKFQKVKITLAKQTKDLKDIVKAAS